MNCKNCYGAVAKMIEPKDAEVARLTQQLSDTQRQNAELMDALKALTSEHAAYYDCEYSKEPSGEAYQNASGLIAASKVSNESAGKP
jgi:hypothetical protein